MMTKPTFPVENHGDKDCHVDIDELIEVALETLVQQAPMSDPSQLRLLVPDADKAMQRFVVIELIKFEMAIAAEAGQLHRVERYVNALPEFLSADSIPIDLVLEEIQLRKEAGESPSKQEYVDRFPQFDSMMIQLSSVSEATSGVGSLGAPPELSIGSEIDDFLIIQKLGRGAFAHVYLARQRSMQRLVALKVSRGKGDEPKALAQFDHPNIVRVFDQRELPDERLHLLYMQFHPGGTLSDVVKSVRKERSETESETISGDLLIETVDRNLLKAAQVLPDRSSVRNWVSNAPWPTVVAWIGVQLARALADAHIRGGLHRDVKPANVLLSPEGIPKLADFNVSFAGAAGRAGAAASFGGSIGYMAPEHLRAVSTETMMSPSEVKETADLFSLAVLLWELWQGNRPFACDRPAGSWNEAVKQQLQSRYQPLIEPTLADNASERVLEKALRAALTDDPNERPTSGAEMAGQLRLALHPEVATLFDPEANSLRSRLANISPWWIAAALILVPNVAAGVFNFFYNQKEIMLTDDMKEGLKQTSFVVNSIAFPLAVVLMVCFTRALARAVQTAKQDLSVESADLQDAVDLGHRSAVIGGTCWLIAGVVYPLVLSRMYPDFSTVQTLHFFVSLLICGGVAMIYPFFGMALVSTRIYYPRMVRSTMQDADFELRAARLVSHSETYLLIAAIIPMLAAALMVTSENPSKIFMLTALGAGVVGLLASFFVYRTITHTWKQLAEVLSQQKSVVPGEQST